MQFDGPLNDACSAYIDGEMSAAEAEAFRARLQHEPSLDREVQVIQSLHHELRSRAHTLRTPIPVEVERSIRMALGAEVERLSKPTTSWLDSVLAVLQRPLVAAGVAAAVLIGVVWIATDRSAAPVSPTAVVRTPYNLYQASYQNFQGLTNGTVSLAKETSNPEELARFFAEEGVPYTVFFPEIDATLLGGMVSEHEGQHYAHLVYGAGDHVVYIFEVDEASIDDQRVALTETVAEDLAMSRWHWEERQGVGTMFVWESNNVICSAVSDLRTQDLSALFTLESL